MSAESERTARAFEDLAACMRGLRPRADAVLERLDRLAVESRRRPLTDVIGDEARPLVIAQLTQWVDELTLAAGELRRAEARQLQGEGRSQQQIADLLGLTRQRVAALLAAGPARPPSKRPRS